MAPDSVSQGENYDFVFELDGLLPGGFTYLLEAKQYPDDTAAISRAVTVTSAGTVPVTVTPAETAALDAGLWYLTVKSTDADETVKSSTRIQIKKAWL